MFVDFWSPQFVMSRLKLFDAALARDKLDLSELQRLSKSGVPEGNGRRSTFWRILLHYLPPNRVQWSEYLAKQRKTYQQFLGFQITIWDTWIKKSNWYDEFSDEMVFVSHTESPTADHPLNPNPCSMWQSFFKDNEVCGARTWKSTLSYTQYPILDMIWFLPGPVSYIFQHFP